MVCPSSNLSLHVLSASSELQVQGGDQASFEKGVDQANTGDGFVGPTGKQGKNKADITWMSSSSSLSPSASPLPAPRHLCLDELLFDATAGPAATAPPVACGSALPSSGCVTCPALPPACGLTLPSSGCWSDPAPLPTRGLTLPLGSGSGLFSSSVPWDGFVPGLWEYVLPEK